MENKGNIVIYQTKEGETSIDVKLENETVWLNQYQMAELFNKDRTVIGRHVNNIYKEGELDRNITCAKFAHMGSENDQQYETAVYNLDVIISVGYRVKSQRGTQFRIWANNILKEYLIKGYAINQQVKNEQLQDLKNTVRLLTNVIEHKQLTLDEATGLLRVITDYTYGLDTLDKYDFQQLEVEATTQTEQFRATYEEAIDVIGILQRKFSSGNLFGNEKDQSFQSSINTIYQTFGGEELYPSIEEKAAMLFYLVVKNHSFSDGNKRIAAFLFLWFLEKNGILYRPDGSRLISNNTLVALTLMIAESRTEEKDIMVKVVINLINKNN